MEHKEAQITVEDAGDETPKQGLGNKDSEISTPKPQSDDATPMNPIQSNKEVTSDSEKELFANTDSTKNPSDIDKILQNLGVGKEGFAYRQISRLCTELQKKQASGEEIFKLEMEYQLDKILIPMSQIRVVTKSMVKDHMLKDLLELIMHNDSHKWKNSDEASDYAKELHLTFSNQHWGEGKRRPETGEDVEEEEVEENETSERPSKRQRMSANSGSSAGPSGSRSGGCIRPSKTHAIYGENGIMKGIILNDPTKANYPRLDPLFNKGKSNIFGDNGLQVGAWWPRQLAALRDGAHGSSQAGIHGNERDGAYSIIVSGTYRDLDDDSGDKLWYSGPGSHENRSKQPHMSTGAMALRRSITTRQPVRVLRTAAEGNKASAHPPVKGVRYDGLYRVTREKTSTNAKQGAFVKFRLHRLPNQPPIDRSRPTPQEQRDYDLAKQGY